MNKSKLDNLTEKFFDLVMEIVELNFKNIPFKKASQINIKKVHKYLKEVEKEIKWIQI